MHQRIRKKNKSGVITLPTAHAQRKPFNIITPNSYMLKLCRYVYSHKVGKLLENAWSSHVTCGAWLEQNYSQSPLSRLLVISNFFSGPCSIYSNSPYKSIRYLDLSFWYFPLCGIFAISNFFGGLLGVRDSGC